MQRFLDDEAYAALLAQQEIPANSRNLHLQRLQEEADAAMAALWNAQEQGYKEPHELNRLQQVYQTAQSALEQAQHGGSQSSFSFINAQLQQQQRINVRQTAISLQSFTEKEKELISAHAERLAPELKKLIAVALEDDHIALDMMSNPVFLRGEGHIYDLSTAQELLGDKRETNYPHIPNKKFKQEDIIPCNTLIRAMQLLLNIINGNESIVPPVEVNRFLQDDNSKRVRISHDIIRLIEGFYQTQLAPKHRAIFDVICRDPLTNFIMDDPVFLPDGYVYDRSTALLLLESVYPSHYASCPRDENITFTKEDITNCYLVISILDQLKENIVAKMKSAASKNADLDMEPKAYQQNGI